MTEYSAKPARHQAPYHTPRFHEFVTPEGVVGTEFHRSGSDYVLRFPGLVDFEVSRDGTRVTAHPVPGTDSVTVEHLYINQVLPLALSRQGRLAYHASAVTVSDGAVAFLGRSGTGKSTLAAQFASTGESFLTDDGLLLEDTARGYVVTPNHPSIRLWPDSQEALMAGGTTLAPAVTFTNKARVMAGIGLPHCDESRQLRAAYLLCDSPAGDEVMIRRASVAESVMGWIRNSFLLDVEDAALMARHFENAALVGSAIPTYHLDYPRQYDRLPDVQAAIMAHMSKLEERYEP